MFLCLLSLEGESSNVYTKYWGAMQLHPDMITTYLVSTLEILYI